MLNIKDTFATVWQPENKGKYTVANLSTSKKDKDGNYTNMSWKAKFVGKNQNVTERMRIKLTHATIEQRKWEEKYFYDVIVFAWEPVENQGNVQETTPVQAVTPVVVVEDENYELPF